jgi:hypothetical protein
VTTDLTFITNEPGKTLKERFDTLIQHARFFDALVGYFFTSGFYAIYPALEKTEKVRILIGISTNRQTYDLMSEAWQAQQLEMVFSHAETKLAVEIEVSKEMEESPDTRQVEQGVFKFIEWLRNGKLEIKVYPSQNIHAKVYIVTFHKFAKEKFEELWKDAVDVSEKYIETLETKTWLNQDIAPYHLYLKFLYEYFRNEMKWVTPLSQGSSFFTGKSSDFLKDLRYIITLWKPLLFKSKITLQ